MTTQAQPQQNTKPANGSKPPPVATAPASASAPSPDTTPATEAPRRGRKPAAEGASADGDAKTRVSRKVYIVTGDIREFKNAAEAERFLNADENAPREFAVIKGLRVEKKQKVSLR